MNAGLRDAAMGPDERLESSLRALSTWDAEPPEPPLWRRALDRHAAAGAGVRATGRIWSRHIPEPVLGALAAVLVVAALVGVFLPALGRARSPALVSSLPAAESSADYALPASSPAPSTPAATDQASTFRPSPRALTAAQQDEAAAPIIQRAVIRKATLELRCPDVPAAAAKATLLLNEAGGEYVQESSLRGEGSGARAQLTLRVAADRMSQVLAELRSLGRVTGESSSGTDVTTQVIDLEARLRNETRVEAELLELLASRDDAPLADVLQLRQQIALVRSEIERLTAQRDQLSRLVSLGTVLLIIRGTDAPDDGGFSFAGAFGDSLGRAWRSGLRALASSVAFLVHIAIGGAIWWALLGLGIVLALRWSSRRRAGALGP